MIGRAALLVTCLASSVVPVTAQGNGHGHAYGQLKSSAPTPSSGGAAQVQTAVSGGVPNFGSWLDDASIMAPGRGSLTTSTAWVPSPADPPGGARLAAGGTRLTRRLESPSRAAEPRCNAQGG